MTTKTATRQWARLARALALAAGISGFLGLAAPVLAADDLKVTGFLSSKVWLYDRNGERDRKVVVGDIRDNVAFPYNVAAEEQVKGNLIPLPGVDGGNLLVDRRDMLLEAVKCPRGMASASGRSLATSGAGGC